MDINLKQILTMLKDYKKILDGLALHRGIQYNPSEMISASGCVAIQIALLEDKLTKENEQCQQKL